MAEVVRVRQEEGRDGAEVRQGWGELGRARMGL